jgi:hypothetical protein
MKKNCNTGCDCTYPSYEELSDVAYAVSVYLSNEGHRYYDYLVYGYGRRCDDTAFKILDKSYSALKKVQKALQYGLKPCIDCEKIARLITEIKTTVSSSCSFDCREDMIVVEKEGYDLWAAENKCCVPYDTWEKAIHVCCDIIEFDYTVTEEKKCDIAYSIIRKEVPCDLLFDIIATSKDCTIKFDYTVDIKKCKIEYDILVKKYDCKIKFDEYVSIKKCGISFDLVRRVYDCNLRMTYYTEDACPALVTIENTLPFTSFRFQNEAELRDRLAQLNITI